MIWWRRLAVLFALPAAIVLLGWLVRTRLAVELARAYFRQHGIHATVSIGSMGLSGVSGAFALGPAEAPTLSADHIELRFDPMQWAPRVVEVRLVAPIIRAQVDAQGKVRLPGLQQWLDDLAKQKGRSRFVSDDLEVFLTGMRALLTTPAGPVEIDGDVRLVKNAPVFATLNLRPVTLSYQAYAVKLRSAALNFDAGTHHARMQVWGDVRGAGLAATGLKASLDAAGMDWSAASLHAASLKLDLAAAGLTLGKNLNAQQLHLSVRNADVAWTNAKLEGKADLEVGATLVPDPSLFAAPLAPVRAHDPVLAKATARVLAARLELIATAHVEKRGDGVALALTMPMILRGAGGARLDVTKLQLSGTTRNLTGSAQAVLKGGGLPSLTVTMPKLTWNEAAFTADTAVAAQFDFAMLRGVQLASHGALSWKAGHLSFAPTACARFALASLHPGASDLVGDLHAQLCPAPGKALFAMDASGWRFEGVASDVGAELPLMQVRLDRGAARLSFASRSDGAPAGTVQVGAARVSDTAKAARFHPVLASGSAKLDAGIWQGAMALRDAKGEALGDVRFRHAMTGGEGAAHIMAPHLTFAPGKLQPETISPLLAAFRDADGDADFSGDVAWQGAELSSHGLLKIVGLDFLTPLGRAHAVKTQIAFTSLLPPVTAPDQQLTIAAIDWTLPFSAIDLRFDFSPAAIRVDALGAGVAEGHVSLSAFAINPAQPGRIAGTAQLSAIALSSLMEASNLGSKIKLEGKISGRVPFTAGPDGFRIVNGHVQADGPGRLSVDRSLWSEGGAINANAVQDFAYQALENLAFDQLSADLNSVAGGRLQVVFHIKGRSDPPKPQSAEIPLTDLINGTALQKPVPLPSGTPIDLTLDASLNFDELLKSYREAWSNTLSPPTDAAPGAAP